MGFQNFLMLDGYQRRALDIFRKQHKVREESDIGEKGLYILESTLIAVHQSKGVRITGYQINNQDRKWAIAAQIIPWKCLLESHYTFQLDEIQRIDMKRVVLNMIHNSCMRSHIWIEQKWEVIYTGLIHFTQFPATFRVTQTEARAIMYAIQDRAWEAELAGHDTSVLDVLYINMERFAPLPAKSLCNFVNEEEN